MKYIAIIISSRNKYLFISLTLHDVNIELKKTHHLSKGLFPSHKHYIYRVFGKYCQS